MSSSSEPPAFRLTPQRMAVLAAARRSDDHPTAREIHARVRDDLPGIGVATVYRTLDLLRDHGYLLELQLGDHPVARYDANTGDHHHVVCADCGAIGDVDVALPAGVAADAERASGFQITAAGLEFVGRCPDCG